MSDESSPTAAKKPKLDDSDEPDHVNTSSDFVARYNGPEVEDMTPEQKEIRDAILKSRPGTGLSGPVSYDHTLRYSD